MKVCPGLHHVVDWIGETMSLTRDVTFLFDIEFSFYVDKTGRRARNGWIIHWEGVPTFCALSLPYIIAFDPSFIEIRHVETVSLTSNVVN
jgi:hypothetical protein